MRVLLVFLIVLFATVVPTHAAIAANDAEPGDEPAVVQPLGEDAGDDDDTVDVQLVVLASIVGIIFILLPLGYLLRRRLGLTAYTPPADSHH
jgi:hypothetical protein